MIKMLVAELWPYIIAAVLAVGGALGMYRKGAKKADARHEARAAKDYRDTRERMNEADISDDFHTAHEWLRERNKSKRDL